MIIRTNPSEILHTHGKDSALLVPLNSPAYHVLGNPSQSFPILPKAFWKDFSRRKSRNCNKKHTLSSTKNKSFPTQGPRAVFLVCVWLGRIYLGRISRTREKSCSLAALSNTFASTNRKASTMKPACACCRYFAAKSAIRQRNECRRHTPATQLANHGHHELAIGIWPAVSPDGWCGEFKRCVPNRQGYGDVNVKILR